MREEGLQGRMEIGIDENGEEEDGNEWGLGIRELWFLNDGRLIEEIFVGEAHDECG